MIADYVVAGLILSGALLGAIGALGVVRLPDVLIRMHASTKTITLACGLIIGGAAVHFGTAEIIVRAIAIMLFILLTAPIAGHIVGRAAVNIGVPLYRAPGQEPPEDKD